MLKEMEIRGVWDRLECTKMMKEGGPHKDHAGCRLHAMLWINLWIVSDRRHVGLGPGVKKRDRSRGAVTAPW